MTNTKENVMGAFKTRNDSQSIFRTPGSGRQLLMPDVGCVHTNFFKQNGLWNTDFPYYGQDSEWNTRIYRIGGTILATDEKIDHINLQDDLKSINHDEYKKDGLFEKYKLFHRHRFGVKSDYTYPIVLLKVEDGTTYENIENTIFNFRKLYKNINFAIVPGFDLELKKKFPSIVTIQNDKKNVWHDYDLIVKINNTSRRAFTDQEVENTNPFIKRLLYGEII